jgi:hypothetical protein
VPDVEGRSSGVGQLRGTGDLGDPTFVIRTEKRSAKPRVTCEGAGLRQEFEESYRALGSSVFICASGVAQTK